MDLNDLSFRYRIWIFSKHKRKITNWVLLKYQKYPSICVYMYISIHYLVCANDYSVYNILTSVTVCCHVILLFSVLYMLYLQLYRCRNLPLQNMHVKIYCYNVFNQYLEHIVYDIFKHVKILTYVHLTDDLSNKQ